MISITVTSLLEWAKQELDPALVDWTLDRVSKIESHANLHYYTSLSLAARQTSAPLKQAPHFEIASPKLTWEAKGWNQRTLIRAIFSLAAKEHLPENFLEEAFNTADLNESIDLYQILPLFGHDADILARASEGLRSNATVIFQSVAHHNPLPLNFADEAWNQMILKSLFVASPMSPILGLEDRWNKSLSQMLTDYAQERISAKRPVPLELWRCITPYLDQEHESMIEAEWASQDANIQAALYLCIKDSSLSWTQTYTDSYQPKTDLSWNTLCPI